MNNDFEHENQFMMKKFYDDIIFAVSELDSLKFPYSYSLPSSSLPQLPPISKTTTALDTRDVSFVSLWYD